MSGLRLTITILAAGVLALGPVAATARPPNRTTGREGVAHFDDQRPRAAAVVDVVVRRIKVASPLEPLRDDGKIAVDVRFHSVSGNCAGANHIQAPIGSGKQDAIQVDK